MGFRKKMIADIKKYGYNHKKPHTYAMTAFRNYDLKGNDWVERFE